MENTYRKNFDGGFNPWFSGFRVETDHLTRRLPTEAGFNPWFSGFRVETCLKTSLTPYPHWVSILGLVDLGLRLSSSEEYAKVLPKFQSLV